MQLLSVLMLTPTGVRDREVNLPLSLGDKVNNVYAKFQSSLLRQHKGL